jgi:predicted transcriptional regulator
MSFDDQVKNKGVVKPTANKLLEGIEQEPVQQEQQEEVIISTGNIQNITVDDVLNEAIIEYVNRLNRPTIDDLEVKTTVYLDQEVYEKLSQICYRKQGLKKIIVNQALKALLNSGKAEQMAKEFDKAKKDQKEAQRRRYNRVAEKFGIDMD